MDGKSPGIEFGKLTSRQRLELDACTRCGECVRVCDSFKATGEERTVVKGMIQGVRSLQRNGHGLGRILSRQDKRQAILERFIGGVYSCTLCGRCTRVCPVGIETRHLVFSLRENIVASHHVPANLTMVRGAVEEEHNVFKFPNQERATWIDFMEDPPDDILDKGTADILYFVGCISSFSTAIQEIPQAFLTVLRRAGVDVMVLGEREWCCGFPMLAAGMRAEAEALRRHNLEELRKTGAKTVVFSCPSCFYTWAKFYRPEGVELVHSTQLLDRLVAEGKLNFKEWRGRITYHDPCDLGRGMGIFDEPRRVIGSIPGAELVEMPQNREMGFCCGGGGDIEIVHPNLAKKISSNLLEVMESTGADLVVSACQQCRRTTQAGIKEKGSALRNLDITELALQLGEFCPDGHAAKGENG